jgi:hypothetical protein
MAGAGFNRRCYFARAFTPWQGLSIMRGVMKGLILSDIHIPHCWLILLLLALVVTGCQASPQPSPTTPATALSTTFAGIIPDTNRFVALVSNGQRARAYVCDGETVAEWFNGEVNEGMVNLTSAGGARLQATLGTTGVKGSLALVEETAVAFTAEQVTAPAGLYRAEENVDGVQYVGGWIVLPDGQIQGALRTVGDDPVITARRAISIPLTLNDGGVVVFPTALGDFQAAQVEIMP